MHDDQQHGADDHDGSPFPLAVVDAAEEGSKQYVAEGEQHRDQARQVLLHTELVHHQVGGILQEGEDRRVEEHAEDGDVPPPLVGQDLADVGDLELLFRYAYFTLFQCFRGIQLLVHHHVDDEGDQADTETDQRHQHGTGYIHHAGSLGDGYRESESHGGTDTGHRHLHPHGHRHLLPLEPFHDDLGDGDAGHLDTHGEGCEADAGPEHLCIKAEEGCSLERVGRYRPVLDGRAGHHHPGSTQTGEAHPQLVEDDPSEDQHQQEDVEPAIGAGEGAIVGTRPAQLSLQQARQRGHDIG